MLYIAYLTLWHLSCGAHLSPPSSIINLSVSCSKHVELFKKKVFLKHSPLWKVSRYVYIMGSRLVPTLHCSLLFQSQLPNLNMPSSRSNRSSKKNLPCVSSISQYLSSLLRYLSFSKPENNSDQDVSPPPKRYGAVSCARCSTHD